MRVLWFTYLPVSGFNDKLKSNYQISSWIEATLESLDKSDITLGFCCTRDIKTKLEFEKNGDKYYCLPFGSYTSYKTGKASYVAGIKAVLDDFKPDIIHLWGTEYPIWLDVISANSNIPVLVSIQGVASEVYRHYFGGLSEKEILKGSSPLDRLKMPFLKHKQNIHYKSSKQEEKIVTSCDAILTDNKWCYNQYKAIKPDIKKLLWVLPLRKEFYNYRWDATKADNATFLSVASYYPLKGLHYLLMALAIVKRSHPDVKLIVPGGNSLTDNSLRSKIFRSPYLSYIKRLIARLDLQSNVEFTGYLSADQLAYKISRCTAFVMSSTAENHSSSLREAMLIGAPCISSYVSCIPEYITDNENGLLYKCDDVCTLAENMLELINDRKLAEKIGNNAFSSIRKKYYENTVPINSAYKEFFSVYKQGNH